MRAPAHADSFVDTTPASFGFPLQAKLRVVVRQNPRRSHVKLKRPQVRVLLDLLDELVCERSRVRLAVYGNLTRRLIIRCDAYVGRRQAFKQMLQNFDRVIMWIECGSESFPLCFGGAHELGSRGVPRDPSIKPPQLKPQKPQIREQQNEN